MKIRVEITLVSLIGLIFIQQCLADVVSGSVASNWTCTCVTSHNQSDVLSPNCSTSCDCKIDRDQWTCLCPADKFPKVAANGSNPTCFTACKCSAGPVSETKSSKKQFFSRKAVLVVLLFCVVITTVAFLASTICYICRKTRFPAQSPLFSSDRESSWNSSTNLISHKSTASQTKTNIGSSGTGCFPKASFFCASKPETLYATIIRFSYLELEQATNKFSNKNLIGIGGSSCVYRGQMKDGTIAAIKRLTTLREPDGNSIFSTEVELLSRLHHFHVVPLIGYCLEFRGKHTERLLVFEYMPNGNLRDCLDGDLREKLTWDTRISIAIGAARGLEYLHEAAAPRILHRDVKSTNILLDETWRAKITDLGMAKCLSADGITSGSSSPARMQGTFGYFAPEYAIVGRASSMSDVFSFGVVLLELITGRQPLQKPNNNIGEESLVIWATPRLQDSKLVTTELPDPHLNGNFPEEEMQIMAYLAKECLLLDPEARPTMREVVQILSTIAPKKSRRRNFPVNLFQLSSEERMKNNNEQSIETEGSVSFEYMERLILMSSKARSWRDSEDETVDLTEPRFESFCLANLKPPLSEPSSHTQGIRKGD